MFMGVAMFATRPITIVLGIVLLRLLSPEDFGKVALVMILVNTSNLFTDLGMRSAVVQTQEDIAKVAWYAFVIVNVFSWIMYGLILAFALPIATILGGDASTVPILQVLGLIVVLDALWIVPEALVTRDLEFKKLMWIKLTPELGYSIMAVILAFMGVGLWSLIWGTLFAEVLRVVFYWIAAKPRYYFQPKRPDWDIIRGLFGYGLPATGASLLRYFADNWDDWYVGRTLGPAALGFYGKAYDTTSRLIRLFTSVLFGNVLQPSYAKVQDQKDRLQRGYLKSTNMVMLLMAPISFGLAILAHIIVLVLLGEKWLPMVAVWQVFALYTLTKPISTNSSPLFLAVGKPRYNLEATVVLLVVMVPLLLWLIGPYGIVGVAVAVAIAHIVGMLFNVYRINTLLPGSAVKTFTGSIPFVGSAALMAVGVQLAKEPIFRLAGGENLISLILLIAIGALIYLSLIAIFQRTFVMELITLANSALGNRLRLGRFIPGRNRS
jgi:PST family polysaccharide transporter